MTHRLASGQFLGTDAVRQSAAGFNVALWRATVPPEAVQPHVHDDAHFVLTLDHDYVSLARERDRPAELPYAAGTLIWNPPGVEHRDSFVRTGSRFLSVNFSPPDQARRGDPVRMRSQSGLSAARRAVGCVAAFQPGDALRLEGLMLHMAACVFAADELDEDDAPDWVGRAEAIIADLAERPGLQVRDVAAMVGVHPVSLARRYRQAYGCSPATAMRQARAARAAAALGRTVDLAELADASGYADQSHLTREFRAIYGLTPARYRALFT